MSIRSIIEAMSRITSAVTMKKLKIIFMGTAELSCASLKKLAGNFSVIAAVTQPDKPKGRERKSQFRR